MTLVSVLDFTSQSNVPVLPPWVSPQEAREVGGMGDKTSKVPIQYSDLSRVLSQQHVRIVGLIRNYLLPLKPLRLFDSLV